MTKRTRMTTTTSPLSFGNDNNRLVCETRSCSPLHLKTTIYPSHNNPAFDLPSDCTALGESLVQASVFMSITLCDL